jgi:putative component of toxin-antitoxin plasmid stabilization module
METEWQIENAYASPGKFKKFAGKHTREYESLFANLEKILRILRGGNKIGSFGIGFFRSEGEGVYRIGQTGVPSAKESRLYIFPDEQNRICYILNIGDKDSQQNDINEAKEIVKRIKSPSVQQ